MTSTTTVSELFLQTYGEEFADIIEKIDLFVTDCADEHLSLEKVADRYLGSPVNTAISQVQIERESLMIEIETQKRHLRFSAKGIWLLIAAFTLASLLTGTNAVTDFLKLIFMR